MFWQIMSNGIYRSIEHRATVNSVKERLSVATFYSPRWEGDMGPEPSLITPESPALIVQKNRSCRLLQGIFLS
jgi:isopenicillin N synthase-like dioxygenase